MDDWSTVTQVMKNNFRRTKHSNSAMTAVSAIFTARRMPLFLPPFCLLDASAIPTSIELTDVIVHDNTLLKLRSQRIFFNEKDNAFGLYISLQQFVFYHLHKAGLAGTPYTRYALDYFSIIIEPAHLLKILFAST